MQRERGDRMRKKATDNGPKKVKTLSKKERGRSKLAPSTGKGPDRAPAKKQRAKNRSHTSHDTSWHRRFEELRHFYRKERHSDVPSPYPENPGLSRWVKRQRWEYALYTAGDTSARAMTPDRIVRLMTLNFTWNLHERSWEKSYNALLAYKGKNGHTRVPSDYKDAHLAQWVRHQRLQIRRYYSGDDNAHITPDRVQRLYDIGFSCNAALITNGGLVLLQRKKSLYPSLKTVQIPAYDQPEVQPSGLGYFVEEEPLYETSTNHGLYHQNDNSTTNSNKRNRKMLRVAKNVNITLLEGDGDDDAERWMLHRQQEETKRTLGGSVSSEGNEQDGEEEEKPSYLMATTSTFTGIDDYNSSLYYGGDDEDKDDDSWHVKEKNAVEVTFVATV